MKILETSGFRPIALEQMEGVKLMNRTDTKFCATFDQINQLIETIQPLYYALTMHGENQLPYATTYFDTPKARMYVNHVRGKKNRYKIRRRTYLTTGIHYLEVKFKTNKGRTIKERITTKELFDNLNPDERLFLEQHTPFDTSELSPGLQNRFKRLTLVNSNFKERCTIDFDLQFFNHEHAVALNDLAIIELKTENRNNKSLLLKVLKELRIKPSGFSKYCMGRTLVDNKMKSNALRPKIRHLQKISTISFLTHKLT